MSVSAPSDGTPATPLGGPAASARRALLIGTGGYLFASVLWGLNIPLSAALLQHFDPFWVSPLRYVVTALLLGGMLAAALGAHQLRSPIALWRVAVLPRAAMESNMALGVLPGHVIFQSVHR